MKLDSFHEKILQALDTLDIPAEISHVYNPLRYAARPYAAYLDRFLSSPKRVLLLGMNPGPWGMAQTGVPFGEIEAVRDWMGIEEPVGTPPVEHPKRPILGFQCGRSEVSGRRLWGLMREEFGSPEAFFADHGVVNYCPLVFMMESGRNFTPDKLPADTKRELHRICDELLLHFVDVLSPEHLVGVGKYAESVLRNLADQHNLEVRVSTVLHPSPASPAANRGWAEQAKAQLIRNEVWSA